MTEPPGSREICPVCWWEDDVYQLRWPYRAQGANKPSLIDAQRNFVTYGSCDEQRPAEDRADPADYDREPYWRPIDPNRDRFEPAGGHLAAWPDDRTVLYWWRRRPGRAWWDDVPTVNFAVSPEGDTDAAAFAAAVDAVASVAPPADPDNLSGMSIDFDYYLWRCSSIRKVTVTTTPDPGRQLTAVCVAEPAASPARVAYEIKETWLRDLRYHYWEAHWLRVTATSVELDVATCVDEDGYYITGLIVVRWSSTRDPGDP
ncbi:CPCC family cysteine-rich protein [Dactylosporangium sp. NBC_01737]|uniref:CPCC family cysteine-rich protein n=1 Tax=Dactylosporangium sp. NBC_01737 TaxID=2975959 RepID=UPI002E14A4F0|nr:CPCC family cysteine-rich protein [Dactylosporangium sp. NBC_01737]